MVRTSVSDPLPIDSVACGGGLIGMTYCPGKQGPSVYGAPWSRDLEADLLAIKAWGASAVVTLVETDELSRLKVPDLGSRVEAHGMDWHHLPIPDVSIPGQSFERRWIYSGHVLRRALQRGDRILVHCRGGRGRTSLLTAKLLVEMGLSPGQAIARVRQAKAETFETKTQTDYAARQTRQDHDEDYLERLLGCLMGGAIGDGFGYAVEFKRLEEIRRLFGHDGLTRPIFQSDRLVVSDDTQMTLFTAAGLAKSVRNGELGDQQVAIGAIRKAYLEWYETQRSRFPSPPPASGLLAYEELWRSRAPGTTCMSAIAAGANGSAEAPINHSKGCGGVMRVAPIGLVRRLATDEVFDLASRAAALTHGHPCGYLSAGTMAVLVRHLLGGLDLAGAVAKATVRLTFDRSHEETLRAVEAAMAFEPARAHDQAIRSLGEGWVGEEALAIALYSANQGASFGEVLRIGANHDGDSDSTASIAGQLWGAEHGLSGIPNAWVRRLDVFDAICDVAGSLLKVDEQVG